MNKKIPKFRSIALAVALLPAMVLILATDIDAQDSEVEFNRSVLPITQKPFRGKAGMRAAESRLDFPAEVKAPKGASNVLLIMPDDVGFGASTPFGGPVPTCQRWLKVQPISYYRALLTTF